MVPGTVLGAGDKAMRETEIPALCSLHSSKKRQTGKQGSTGDTGWLLYLNIPLPPPLLALPTSVFRFMLPRAIYDTRSRRSERSGDEVDVG